MHVELRPVGPQDLASIAAWAARLGPLAPSRTLPLATGADCNDPGRRLFWYVVVADGRELGTVWVERLGTPREGRLGVFLGDSADFGRGIGQSAVRLATACYAAAYPDEPITLHVRTSNQRAIGCYRAVGFEAVDSGEKVLPDGRRIAFLSMVLSSQARSTDTPNKAFEQTRRSSAQDRSVGARSSTPMR